VTRPGGLLSRVRTEIPSVLCRLLAGASILYTIWVLFGVIAFVTKLGDDLRAMLGPQHKEQGDQGATALLDWFLFFLFPAGGAPRRDTRRAQVDPGLDATAGCFRGVAEYLRWNLPLAAVFLLQHTGMRLMKRWYQRAVAPKLAGSALVVGFCPFRILYNLLSALTLHFFMHRYRVYHARGPHDTTLTLPCSGGVHFSLSTPVILYAFTVFLTSDECADLLLGVKSRQGETKPWAAVSAGATSTSEKGIPGNSAVVHGDAAKATAGLKATQLRRAVPTLHIDVITLMARTVTWKYGSLGFVLFSGLSIIPRTIRLDDVLVRLVAAVYLRKFSPHFCRFSNEESAKMGHKVAWVARAILIGAAVLWSGSDADSDLMTRCFPLLIGGGCAVLLHLLQ